MVQKSRKFPNAMLKEIYEQPHAIRETIRQNVDKDVIFPSALQSIESALFAFKKIIIAASGSSRHAGLAGEIMMEDLAGVAVDVEYSSEYCFRSTHAASDPIVVVITQSGETADTIAAQREALNRSAKTVAISNVASSTISREASATLLTRAGVEKAVPATKSFTAQVTLLYLFALFLARKRGRMTSEVTRSHLNYLAGVPVGIEKFLARWDEQSLECARVFQRARAFLYLGRGVHYAIAREGALKLKEISYVQAEGLPAGELRHGPSALVDDKLPVVVLATRDAADPDSMLRYQKTLTVLEYIKSRRGKSIAIATAGDREVENLAERTIFVPAAPELLLPILEVVPLQLFSYHFAMLNGCDVDNPRNLAKSVVTL
ncbi:MAG: isomerizing glutamine--fructose-6-phosphate transaminase [Candidatus Acidiferrales bacterium]